MMITIILCKEIMIFLFLVAAASFVFVLPLLSEGGIPEGILYPITVKEYHDISQ